ncbi:MAG: YncE family protein [Ferruginibacter sp.]
MNKKIISLVFFISIISLKNAHAQKNGMHLINTFHIASSGGWDYLQVGPVNDWLYVSHGTQVNVLNKKTGDSVAIIENTTGVHGIAFDVANKKGFTSNGRLNNVTVFDMNTNKVLAQIPAGQNPDAIFYESFSKTIITCNGRGKNISFIDPVQDKVIDSIDVGGKPETAVSNGKGKIYVNIEDKNEIVEIDIKTKTVMAHWGLSPAEEPTGLAFDKANNRLFAGCDKLLVVLDAADGRIVTTLPIGDGCDGVAFDPVTKNIYTANGEGNMTIINEDKSGKFSVVENVETKKGARTIALDEATHIIYLPTAEFEPLLQGERRAKMKAGTFQILVISK